MTTDNTQVGLKKLCEAFIDGDISAGQFKRAVRIWHNKQVEEVLDRLEADVWRRMANTSVITIINDERKVIERIESDE